MPAWVFRLEKSAALCRQARNEVIDWLTFYNHRRLHATLDYVSPIQFEKCCNSAQQLKAAQ
jgi:hypothetical protein